MLDAVVEKLLLLAHDAARHLVDRLLPLVDGLDEPQCASQLLFDVLTRRLVVVRLVLEHASVYGADPELRKPVLVEDDLVLAVHFDDVDVRRDVVALLGRVTSRLGADPARRMISQCSITSSTGSFIAFAISWKSMILEEVEMLQDTMVSTGVPAELQATQLERSGTPSGPARRRRWGRSPGPSRSASLHVFDGVVSHRAELFDRRLKVALFVDVPDDRLANLANRCLRPDTCGAASRDDPRATHSSRACSRSAEAPEPRSWCAAGSLHRDSR